MTDRAHTAGETNSIARGRVALDCEAVNDVEAIEGLLEVRGPDLARHAARWGQTREGSAREPQSAPGRRDPRVSGADDMVS